MELFRLLGTIAIDNTEANNALADTSTRANDTANETESAFSKIGGVATKIATGIGIAGAAIGGAFIGAVEGTREYRTEMGLLESAFLTAGHSSEEAKRTYSELNAVLGDSGQAVEASQHLAKIADNEKELSELTGILTGVYATFGESLPLEGLAEGINHTASLGEVQGSLADALEWSGISVDSFNEQLAGLATEEERQDLIVKTLNDTYSKASEQYQKTNADVMAARQAQERLKDAMAAVGEVGEPIMTAITNAIAGMAEKAVPVIETTIQKFRDMSQWVKDNETKVHAWIAVLIVATTTIAGFILLMKWSAIMSAAANAIKVVTVAVKALNAAMRANLIGIIVSAIIGLVAAFIYLWNNVEGFRKFWIKAWNLIKDAAQKAWSAIKKAFNNIGSWFKDKFAQVQKAGKDTMDKVKKWFSDTYRSITRTFANIGSWFGSKFRSAWNAIKNAFSGWGSFFSGLWGKVKSKFGSIGTSIGTAMGNAVKNGMNGALSKVESAINKGIGLINSAIRLANKLPGINVGTVGKISLPRLAKGGVLERGQIGLLEGSGAEAVVPLENNRAWLTRVAEDLNEIQMTKRQPVTDDAIMVRLNRIIELLERLLGMNICLDSGALVGELAPAMNSYLGKIYSHEMRGNTR